MFKIFTCKLILNFKNKIKIEKKKEKFLVRKKQVQFFKEKENYNVEKGQLQNECSLNFLSLT